jgi:hypothetical protein
LNNEAMRVVAEKASKTKADAKTAPEVQKVGDFYAAGWTRPRSKPRKRSHSRKS